MKTKICHLTSVHPYTDTRILLKECKSLAEAGYDVYLVAKHDRDEIISGVQVKGVKRKGSYRLTRILFYVWKIYWAALSTKSSIYHFHDPELFLPAAVMRMLGKKVIFDIHENVSEQIKGKEYLPFRNTVSRIYGVIDYLASKWFYIVVAEYSYESIYKNNKADVTTVLNMPDIQYLKPFAVTERRIIDKLNIFYVGGVSFDRCIHIIIDALLKLKTSGVDFHFHCIGPAEPGVMDEIRALNAFPSVAENIAFYGPKKLDEAFHISMDCHIGLSILIPIENLLHSYSTKIFEYMAVGLPFITSNFELYKNVVEKHHVGFCIDPYSADELAFHILQLLRNESLRNEFGSNGTTVSRKYFNWESEKAKLLHLYKRISS